MKGFLTALILGSLLAFSVTAQVKNDKERYGLLGQVKTLEMGGIEYTLKDGKVFEGRRIPIQKITFNTEGNIAELTGYNQDGSISRKSVYTYGSSGKNTGYEEYSSIFDKTLTVPRRHVYVLDERGNKVEYIGYDSNGTLGNRFFYKYDDTGNKLEEIFYAWNGALINKIVYAYDGRGNQTMQTVYNGDGSISSKTVTAYNSKGSKTEWVQYVGEILKYKVLYKYDNKGRVIEQETQEFNKEPNVSYSHAPVPGKIIYTYDDEKKTKEVATYKEDGALKETVIYTHDGKGNEIGRDVYNADGTPKDTEIHFYDKNTLLRTLRGKALVEFEYDSHGNWTRKIHLIKHKNSNKPDPYGAEYRTITYLAAL